MANIRKSLKMPRPLEYDLRYSGKWNPEEYMRIVRQWPDIFFKEDAENEQVQCQKCDHRR